MSSVLTPDDRKARLDAARNAAASGDVAAIRSALAELPRNGKKANELRAKLVSHLRRGDAQLALDASPSIGPVLKRGGFEYHIRIARSGSSSLYRVEVRGATVCVHVDPGHPACAILFDTDHRGPQAAISLFVSLAILEVEAGSERRREHDRDWGDDLARVFTSIAREVAGGNGRAR